MHMLAGDSKTSQTIVGKIDGANGSSPPPRPLQARRPRAEALRQCTVGVVLCTRLLARCGTGVGRLGILPLNCLASSVESPCRVIFSTLPVTLLMLCGRVTVPTPTSYTLRYMSLSRLAVLLQPFGLQRVTVVREVTCVAEQLQSIVIETSKGLVRCGP
jgi:hypothetical protein